MEIGEMNEIELKKKTKVLALRVVKSTKALPTRTTGTVIGQQIVRSDTSHCHHGRVAKDSNSNLTRIED